MVHVARSKTADEMQQFAHRVYKDITSGPGTPHARLKRLSEMLIALAKENYEAGVEDGKKEAKEAQALVAGMPAVVAPVVPPPSATSP